MTSFDREYALHSGSCSNRHRMMSLYVCRDAGAKAGQGGQKERKGTEDHIQQIFIILFPNHVLLILLGTDFPLIRK